MAQWLGMVKRWNHLAERISWLGLEAKWPICVPHAQGSDMEARVPIEQLNFQNNSRIFRDKSIQISDHTCIMAII